MLEEFWGDVVFRVRWDARAARDRTYVSVGLWVARHLPRWVRYWVTIDSISRATTGKYGDTEVPALHAMDVLDRI
jgi:hypothetical protein